MCGKLLFILENGYRQHMLYVTMYALEGMVRMRKSWVYILAVVVLLLAACSDDVTKDEHANVDDDQSAAQGEQEQEGEKEAIEEGEMSEQGALYKLDAIWGFQPIDDADAKVVLLTIDDAPDKYALEMAKTLKELDAPAIFFVNGHFLQTDEQKEILKEIHDMGFTIGNHTDTHANLQSLSEKEQKEEILIVSDIVEEVIGERPKYFRAPFGQNTEYTKSLVEEEGMLLMNWSFGYDWEKQYMNAESLANIMVNTEYMRDGANLLMHDRKWTAEALVDIVNGFREKGYGFIDPETILGIDQTKK